MNKFFIRKEADADWLTRVGSFVDKYKARFNEPKTTQKPVQPTATGGYPYSHESGHLSNQPTTPYRHNYDTSENPTNPASPDYPGNPDIRKFLQSMKKSKDTVQLPGRSLVPSSYMDELFSEEEFLRNWRYREHLRKIAPEVYDDLSRRTQGKTMYL